MFVRFEEIMNLPSFKNIKLVAGKNGLYRNISWVYTLQTDSFEDWIQGGELVFIVNKKDYIKILEESVENKISGLVILKTQNNESQLSPEMIEFANKNEMPLFEMDYHIRLLDIMKEISSYIINKQKEIDDLDRFLYNLLFSKNLKKEEIHEYSMILAYQKNQVSYICVLDCVKEIKNIDKIRQTLRLYLDDNNVILHSIILNDTIIMLVIVNNDYVSKSKKILRNVFDILNHKYANNLEMGIGSIYESIYDIKESYYQALKTFALINENRKIVDYMNLGFSRLLLNTPKEDLEKYLKAVLGKIFEYDNKNDTNLLKTLETYILCNGNISKTSNILFIHRNTCLYRMEKIKKILNIDYDDPYIRADILNCIMIDRYLKK